MYIVEQVYIPNTLFTDNDLVLSHRVSLRDSLLSAVLILGLQLLSF